MTPCPDYPADVTSLIGVLGWQHARWPERAVCHRVVRDRRGVHGTPLSIEAMLDRAGRVAAHLREAGVGAGDRVILALGDPHDFLVAFVGVLGIGASAVPLPPPSEAGAPRSFAARLRAVTRDCAPAMAIVDDVAQLERTLGTLPPEVRVCEPRAYATSPIGPLTDAPGSATAVIQYTSGSTGTPKGVVVTHANILANCRAIRDATGYTRDDRMLSWLPLHHDMGLVGGLLTSIYCAAETWIMSPLGFLARPVSWLEAITASRARLTVAPTFAYNLCARKVPNSQMAGIDLGSLRLAYVGAEPVVPSVMRAFRDRFTDHGLRPNVLYPVYGLAEATLAVTFPRPETPIEEDRVIRSTLVACGDATPAAQEDADAVTFVSVGHPLPGHRVTIRDLTTGRALPERRVGEVVVEGPSISPGYFADGAGTPRATLATGDLGYVAGGHVYIVDRIKDLVIIAGRNYAPSDIEQSLDGIPGLRSGRCVAFAAPNTNGLDALHIVAEAAPDVVASTTALDSQVRAAVRTAIGLAVATVTIVAPGSLERTSSGKIARRACVEAHHRGALVPREERAS